MSNTRPSPVPRFHHVGVQTNDLDNSLAWYQDYFGCRPMWTLDAFSELTRSRLPGITRLTELMIGDIRLHLFERPGRPAPAPGESVTHFQHVCLAMDRPEDLVTMRDRWLDLYRTGRYRYAVPDPPTDVVVDADGVHSCYTYDVNGLEFEFTYVPGAAP